MSSQARQSQWTKDRRAKIKTQKTLGSSLRPYPPELQRGADSPSVHECQCGSGWGHNSWAHVFHRHDQMVSRDPGKDAAHIPDKCQGCSPQRGEGNRVSRSGGQSRASSAQHRAAGLPGPPSSAQHMPLVHFGKGVEVCLCARKVGKLSLK